MTEKRGSIGAVLRDVFPSWTLTLLVALFVHWFLREQVLDAYPVPTPSMEPTIEGETQGGDYVLVDKTADQLRNPRRHDMVVFRGAETNKILVKRVLGLGGEFIRIRNYDIEVGRTPETMQAVVKLPARDRDLLVSYWDSAAEPWGSFWRISKRWKRLGSTLALDEPGTGELFEQTDHGRRGQFAAWDLHLQRTINTGYVDGFGRRQEHNVPAFDIGASIVVSAQPETKLWIALRYGRGYWALRYDGAGEASFWIDGKSSGDPLVVPGLAPDSATEIVFVYLDGAFRVAVDNQDIGSFRVPFHDLQFKSEIRSPNGIEFAVRDGAARLERLEILHDFHYVDRPGGYACSEPYAIPKDHYFVLGDNSPNSTDSRKWGGIPAEDIVGRPLAIGAPWKRRRWLTR
ncbi:MAG: signal peptidase I [Planctomycetes bacterium]|nr:signal peptidase I [Planctomycetota bacterium]